MDSQEGPLDFSDDEFKLRQGTGLSAFLHLLQLCVFRHGRQKTKLLLEIQWFEDLWRRMFLMMDSWINFNGEGGESIHGRICGLWVLIGFGWGSRG